MTSSRPYLIRALYEWIVDNGFTPYMLVDTSLDVVEVPRAFVENGRIILNIKALQLFWGIRADALFVCPMTIE